MRLGNRIYRECEHIFGFYYNQNFNANTFQSIKERYNTAIEYLAPQLQDAIEEYNTIENRLIIARGELNAAYSDMMYANRMLDSLSKRSPSDVPPGAVDYWRNKRDEAEIERSITRINR